MAETPGEDRIILDALSEEDLQSIASNERYRNLLIELLGSSQVEAHLQNDQLALLDMPTDNSTQGGADPASPDNSGHNRSADPTLFVTRRSLSGADPTTSSQDLPLPGRDANPTLLTPRRPLSGADPTTFSQDRPLPGRDANPTLLTPRGPPSGADPTTAIRDHQMPDRGTDPTLSVQPTQANDPPTVTDSCRETLEPLPKRQRMSFDKPGLSGLQPFDPTIAGAEEDEFVFKPPDTVSQYIERFFRKGLPKKERKAMLKADPKPDTPAVSAPEVDQFISIFWGKKVNLTADKELKQLQDAVLHSATPLAGLWASIAEQGLDRDPEALIQVPVVLESIQRALVLLGNANHYISETRRTHILEAVDPKLTKYAKGDFSDSGKYLFGPSFQKEIVSQVEADTALSKAFAIVGRASSRGPKATKGPRQHQFFRGGRAAAYGGGSGANVFNPYSRGQYSQPRHNQWQQRRYSQTPSILNRLGPPISQGSRHNYPQKGRKNIPTEK